jgi:hypothetical protein
MGYTKEDVDRCYHDIGRRSDCDCPHVNVKVRRGLEDVDFSGADCDIPEGLTLEWIEANLSADYLSELFWHVCSNEWEMLEQDAAEVFGAGAVEIHAGGRSGGWACVTGLPDIADWDAVALAKWRRFERYAKQIAHGIPEQMVYAIAANEWEAAQAADMEEAGRDRDPVALAGVTS